MARPDLKLVPEDFVATSASSPEDRAKAHQAAGIREGKRRANAELGETIKTAANAVLAPIKALHAEHLKQTAKANYHQGFVHALVLGILLAAAAGYAGAWLQTKGWSMSVADERIPRAVPVLQDEGNAPVTYESHGCEPGNCGN
mgnify:CR=1 FL=1